MLYSDFLEYLDQVRTILAPLQPHLEAIENLLQDIRGADKEHRALLITNQMVGDQGRVRGQRIHALVGSYADRTNLISMTRDQFGVRQAFVQITINEEKTDYLALAQELVSAFDPFISACDDYIRSRSPENVLALLTAAENILTLESDWKTLQRVATQILEFTSSAPGPETDGASCVITVESPSNTIANFAKTVQAFNVILEETHLLLGVAYTEESLTFKIESGSAFLRIFGKSQVIKFFVWFLKACLGFMYRNFSSEGRISTVPQKIDLLNKEIGLIKKLKELGVNTEDMTETIAKSAVLLVNATNENFGQLYAVEIDKEIVVEVKPSRRKLHGPRKQISDK